MTRDLKLLMVSMFFWGAGEGLFIYLYPVYLEQLGANPVAIGSVMSLSALVLAGAHIPAGWLADRFGRKRVMAGGWVVGCTATLCMFLAPSLAWFVPGLVLYVFTGYVISPMCAYITEARGTLSVQRALTLNSAFYAAGTLFSPALGGQIARGLGLRSVFAISLVIFLVSTGLIFKLNRQPVAAPHAGVNRYGKLLANRRFVSLMLLAFAAAMAFQIGFPLAPNFLADVRHYDVALIGLLGSFNALGITVLSVALGHRPPRGAFMVAQGLMALSLGLLLSQSGLGWMALVYFFRGSWSLARNMTSTQVGQVVDQPELGLAYGVTETVLALTLILGPLAAGFLYARVPSLPFQISLVLLVVTIPLVWAFAPRAPAPAPDLAGGLPVDEPEG